MPQYCRASCLINQYDSRAFMFDAALSGNVVILADPRLTAANEAADHRLRIFLDWLLAKAAL